MKTCYYVEDDSPGVIFRFHRWDREEVIEDIKSCTMPDDLLRKLSRTPGSQIFGHCGEINDIVVKADGRYHLFCDYDYGGTFTSLRAAARWIQLCVAVDMRHESGIILQWTWYHRLVNSPEIPTDEFGKTDKHGWYHDVISRIHAPAMYPGKRGWPGHPGYQYLCPGTTFRKSGFQESVTCEGCRGETGKGRLIFTIPEDGGAPAMIVCYECYQRTEINWWTDS